MLKSFRPDFHLQVNFELCKHCDVQISFIEKVLLLDTGHPNGYIKKIKCRHPYGDFGIENSCAKIHGLRAKNEKNLHAAIWGFWHRKFIDVHIFRLTLRQHVSMKLKVSKTEKLVVNLLFQIMGDG